MPKVEIDGCELGAAGAEAAHPGLGHLVAAVQVEGVELVQPSRNVLEASVRHEAALADVEDVEVHQRLADLGHALVRHFGRHQRQLPEVEEAAGDVGHGAVRHAVAEREVEVLEANATLGEVTHADVADVVTGAEVKCPQRGHPRQGLHPRVRDVGAEAEVERGHGEALGDVPQREVAHLLAVLEVEVLQGRGGAGGGQGQDPRIRDLPARAQVEPPQPAQPPGDGLEAGVGNAGTSAQLEVLEVGAVGGDEVAGAVGDLLAEAEVNTRQCRQVLATQSVTHRRE